MHFLKSNIVILAATCKLALAYDCYSPRGMGGCIVTVNGVDYLKPALRPEGFNTPSFSCQRGLCKCCDDATFDILPGKNPDPNRCQPA
ncbi:hypothetical protein Pst134EA_015447 [Puccinia striiformis f. sp. tritici]|uniref:hypothetical protein n=1 Tax=Puccinia striiformis f. sp. tritici TaxID=168172 RepID=UPI002007D2F3|nr:hypothetical protein Pst134EA_015447 [Puccinia striiformis f. sp. tritici]KAH9452606.1 hypothetical protein Pst134EB_016562 [Puccinia striiformis f. sp. tritici]KAH9463362.1 hypothetical protein Pst134EA_015447 [Puccinia striiformis f. sp. tritici]